MLAHGIAEGGVLLLVSRIAEGGILFILMLAHGIAEGGIFVHPDAGAWNRQRRSSAPHKIELLLLRVRI